MPQTTYEKSTTPRGIVYDTLAMGDFDTITVGVSQANTVVQALFPLPCAIKIFGVAVVGGSAIAGLTSFNIVLGPGVETGVPVSDNSETIGWPPSTAVAGNQLFAVDQPITAVANVPQTFGSSVIDAVWPKGGLLTLRIVSTAGGAGTLKVKMLYKPYDVQPQAPSKFNRPLQYSDL